MFVCASIISILSLGNVEGRPIRKSPCLDSAKVSPTIPLKLDAETSALPTKEAKRCHQKRHRRGCDEVRTIRRVPITITRSGKYCVTRDLTYDGAGAAITIAADNVTINFANHNLFLTDPAAEGILAVDVEELTILNDKISTGSVSNIQSSNAIHLIGVSKARIDNVFTENTFDGINIETSNDVTVTNSHHKNHVGGFFDTEGGNPSGSGIEIRGSVGVTIDNAYFEGSSGENQFSDSSITIANASSSINITNTKHNFVSDAIFVAQGSSGILVENLTATFDPLAFYSGISVGGANDEIPTNDLIFRNVTLTHLNAFEGWDGVNIGIATGIIFENVIIDTNTSVALDFTPAALHFGCADINGCEGEDAKFSTNGLFSKVIISNNNDYGLLVEAGVDLVFDNIEVTGSSINNVYLSTSYGNTVKNSYIGDSLGGNGIAVSSSAIGNAILNNVVTSNETGIIVYTGATQTRIEENHVFANITFGINVGMTDTQTYYNRSCGNGPSGSSNCSGVFPSNNPGDPSVVGENICCSVED